MLLPKPEPRAKVKAREDRKAAAARKAARIAVLIRELGRCQRCGAAVSDDFPEWHPQRAHVNEIVPRSLCGSAVDLENLELLCQGCHLPNGRHAPTAERMARLKGAA